VGGRLLHSDAAGAKVTAKCQQDLCPCNIQGFQVLQVNGDFSVGR
jgi:hypothetical protein